MARSKNTTVLGHNLFLRLFFFLTFALISFISTPPQTLLQNVASLASAP